MAAEHSFDELLHHSQQCHDTTELKESASHHQCLCWRPKMSCMPSISLLCCLQGGSEARHSNELLHHIISNAIDTVAPEVGSGLIALVNSRDEIRDLLKLDDVIDLVSSAFPLVPHVDHRRL